MEALVLILVIVFFAVTGKKKKPASKGNIAPGVSSAPKANVASGANVAPGANAARTNATPGANVPRYVNRVAELKRAIEERQAANGGDSDFLKALAGMSEGMSVGEGSTGAVNAAVPVAGADLEATRRAQAARQARLYEDEEGCVGGSMAHEHTEGENRREHRRHMEAVRRREADESRAESDALDLAHMNVRKLRQAIVAAEVLGKPVALRSRGAASR